MKVNLENYELHTAIQEQSSANLISDFLECGCNSVVECKLPKLDVAGSNPVARSDALSIYRGSEIFSEEING